MIYTTEGSPLWVAAKEMYSRGLRGYHNFDHALDVLERVEMIQGEIGFVNYEAVRLAALFHDAVYTAGETDNEFRSVIAMKEKAREVYNITDAVSEQLIQADNLIMATSQHMVPNSVFRDWDTMLFLDCDVLGFAENWEQFKRQSELIAFEYGDYARTEAYKEGRIKFLKALYKKGVFRSPYFKKHYEERALLNINASLKELVVAV